MLCLGAAIAAYGVLRAAHAARMDIGACIAALGCAAAGALCGAVCCTWRRNACACTRSQGFAHPGLAFFGGALGGVGRR